MSQRYAIRMQRLIAAVTLCLAFLVMASIFAPDSSEAERSEHAPETDHEISGHATPGHAAGTGEAAGVEAGGLHSADPHEGLPSLGTLDAGRYTVLIHSTPAGPRYTVLDASGEQLGVLLTAEQVAERFEDLPLSELHFDASAQRMRGDQGRGH